MIRFYFYRGTRLKNKIKFLLNQKFPQSKNVEMKVTTRLYYGLIVASKAKIYIMFRLYMYMYNSLLFILYQK